MSRKKYGSPFCLSPCRTIPTIHYVFLILAFFLLVFSSRAAFAVAPVAGQAPPGYVLVKTAVSPPGTRAGTIAYQWIASNKTSRDGNFFILEDVPSHYGIQSIVDNSPLALAVPLDPPLPFSGPGTLKIGPFPINANSSVTFNVTGNIK